MRFIIFVIDDGNNLAKPDEMSHIDAFNQMLIDNNHFVHAAGINHGSNATLIDNRQGTNQIEIGSLQTDPAHYSGFWLIQADSQELALQLAKEASLACNRKVELRPYLR